MSKRQRVCIRRWTCLVLLLAAVVGVVYALCRFTLLRQIVGLLLASIVLALIWEAVEQ